VKFEKIRRKTTLEQAIEAIKNYIVTNKLQEGDSLPPEMELADALGISRNILREALRHYRTLGIIGSKPKIGTFIARLAPENPYRGYLPFIAANEDSMRELAEARIVLECGAASLIAARATPERVRELEAINARLEETVELDKRLKLEIELHSAMLRIAGNTIINGLIPLLVNFFQQRLQSGSGQPGHPRHEVDAEHRRIIDAIARRDGNTLAGLLRAHGEEYLQ
jgi:DNA-binding FadR family transcriptional regulator